jgi:hypothetical protein
MNKRPLTELELKIINKLLSKPFVGSRELREQIYGCTATSTDDADNYGSIFLFPSAQHRAEIKLRVPVEGLAKDADGGDINILLHVVDGFLNELEIVKLDGTPLESQINIDDVEVELNQ